MAEKLLRCAVYTRKSTDDGLEQEFNSLDAQYEACAAYALSQHHEGWVLAKDRYDDGGFSGGNMERPGLKCLLADVEAGKVDIILLYKIDRLTRSLTDFARIVEVLDRAGASFVSITQSFNTTTSMGRLTLNMLLSFAQFEREVTGERIRDKIAASKKKGLWMGGPVPLGYEVCDRKLVVKDNEAEQVRHLMRRYLALGSVPALAEELNREGYRTKVQRRTSGPHRGGCIFRRGTLYHLLSNRIYRGFIVHKDRAYPGEHQPIVDAELWDAVQKLLADNASGSSRRLKHQHPSLLIGKLVDGEGRQMGPSHATKNRKRYRYYVTRLDELGGTRAWRVSAHDLEQMVCAAIAGKLADQQFVLELARKAEHLQNATAEANALAATLSSGNAHDRAELIAALVRQVRLSEDRIGIELDHDAVRERLGVGAGLETGRSIPVITIPAVRVRRGHQLRLIVPGPENCRPTIVRRDEKLVSLVAEAHQARQLVLASPARSIASIASEHSRCRTRLGKLVALSCLAPDIVTAIVEGRQPKHLTAKQLMSGPLPLSWTEQRRELGFA
ncbi:recombinase family protein [Altererythrobacter marinus]|uniref:Recombinase family protein n=1 Tax=Pelagerythrobacter marinus TaxID=538382 RepID=A0ABW9UX94_9SPHN|nr:recombinase family protein [Pelagerythrobacter marinus]MXO69439.1 recombinase family protein [Pelagerythrobacter marinus]